MRLYRSFVFEDEPLDWRSDRKPATYREFRRRLLDTGYFERQLTSHTETIVRRLGGYPPTRLAGLAQGRAIVSVYREVVARRMKELCAEQPFNEVFARRALRIPEHVPVRLPVIFRVAGALFSMFMPMLALRIASGLLRSIGTSEGRALVFEMFEKLATVRKTYYGDRLDFMVRRFAPPRSKVVLEALQYFDVKTMRNAWHLGLSSAEELHAVFCGLHRQFPEDKLAVLIRLGVIRTVDELSWLQPWSGTHDGYNREAHTRDDGAGTIRRLLAHGVPREQTLSVLDSWYRCDPERLDQNLSVLATRGYTDTAKLFATAGELLWLAVPANWGFLLDVIGAQNPEQWPMFHALLEEPRLPAEDGVRSLRERGASLEQLAALQSLLHAMMKNERDPRSFVDLMCSAPYALTLDELATCLAYSTRRTPQALIEYLGVIAQHGLARPGWVVAMQELYVAGTSALDLDRLLTMCRRLRDAPKGVAAIIAWVRSVSVNRIRSLEYLMSVLPVPDRAAFDAIRPLAQIGASLLEYATQACGLQTVHALRAWRKRSPGVEQIRWTVLWRDPAHRIILDDASRRGSFAFVDANLSALSSAVRDLAFESVGNASKVPHGAAREEHWQRWNAVEAQVRTEAVPALADQLDTTGGMLAACLIKAYLSNEEKYSQAQLDFRLAVASLLRGHGPSGAEPSELELEAVAAVYGVDVHEADSRWSYASGLEHHLDGISRRTEYRMVWQRRPVVLHRLIDTVGVSALREALEYGAAFRGHASDDLGLACEGLSPRLLGDRSAGPQTFTRHLGVLLGILQADLSEKLTTSIEELADLTDEVSQRYAAADRIAVFFDIGLHDAIADRGVNLVASFSPEVASKLTSRLGKSAASSDGADARGQLVAMLGQVADRVRHIYGAWAHRQVDAFEGRPEGESNENEYLAYVSKHPAAFFAKEATGLCSSSNVDMWREKRHSHLVVFDPSTRRLAGMAMLYFQTINAIDERRATLVMRAINTVDQTDSSYSAESIVDAFLRVAQEIAQDNDLAAVVFPSDDGGQHFMSNRNAIHSHIEKMCANALTRRPRSRFVERDQLHEAEVLPYRVHLGGAERFYGYHEGQGAVSTLYVMWQHPETDLTAP